LSFFSLHFTPFCLNFRDDNYSDRGGYQQASNGCMLALAKVKKASVIKKLKEKVKYEAEFSSVASAYIRKNAPEPVVASVFE